MQSKPLFSICHTSARPDKWREIYDAWMSKAVNPGAVEYVLCIDPRWEFSLDPSQYDTPLDNLVLVQNTGRRCYVDGVNLAARASSGMVLVVNADDQFACDQWDNGLVQAIAGGEAGRSFLDSFVVRVSTGTPEEFARKIMVMPVLSRKRFEDQGSEVMYSGYESMCSDNDFCEHAEQDGVVIEATHLLFPHKHPLYGDDGKWRALDRAKWDAAYQAQNNPDLSRSGMELLRRRRAAKFAPVTASRSIALMISGETFLGPMLDAWMDLYAHVINKGWGVYKLREHTSNVYVTRESLRRALVKLPEQPEFVLWCDDDNPLSVAQFEQLVEDLDGRPDVDGVAGWCWIHNQLKAGFVPSCGLWAPDHLHWQPFPSSFARETKLREFECGGFPCFLMRYSAIEKAGDSPFLPVIDNRLEHGILGEDFAFFLNAEQAKFLVDPRVRVPHLKYVEVCPVFEEEGGPGPVKVAGMLRVKNEARWIARVIESIKPLCGEHIYVMEDGSTDDTAEAARAAGAVVWKSPFDGQGLDERRDKNWLLAKVKAECSPDWILMPDGDEELEPGGCDTIRRVLESNPRADCFALRVLNLWNDPATIRIDGAYGRMARQSLFRADTDLEFVSYYQGEGENHNHVGLHVSNAPGLGGVGSGGLASLAVSLLHYGYMLPADRVRKYRWITSIDPHNEHEGFYLHTVQGDIPEVPKDKVLKHGGPLELVKLPARMVPQWSEPVKPLEELVQV